MKKGRDLADTASTQTRPLITSIIGYGFVHPGFTVTISFDLFFDGAQAAVLV